MLLHHQSSYTKKHPDNDSIEEFVHFVRQAATNVARRETNKWHR